MTGTACFDMISILLVMINILHHVQTPDQTCRRSDGPLHPPLALGERTADTGCAAEADGEATGALVEEEGGGSKGSLVTGAPTFGHFLAPCEAMARCGTMSWRVPEVDDGGAASLGWDCWNICSRARKRSRSSCARRLSSSALAACGGWNIATI